MIVTMFQPPAFSYRKIYLDCDSTLGALEGINELARLKSQYDYIADLTRRAMDGTVKFEKVFAARLEVLHPTRRPAPDRARRRAVSN